MKINQLSLLQLNNNNNNNSQITKIIPQKSRVVLNYKNNKNLNHLNQKNLKSLILKTSHSLPNMIIIYSLVQGKI